MNNEDALTPDRLAAMLDHTLLKPEATRAQVERLCDEAALYRFACAMVNPCWVSLAAERLRGTNVPVGVVIGFPLGATLSASKQDEAARVLREGAHDVDMVLNIGFLKSGMHDAVGAEIAAIAAVVHGGGGILKVILETALLTDEEKEVASQLSIAAGADFIKTSTGFASGGATTADIRLMRRLAGERCGVKASGGIRTLADATTMLRAGANRIGASASVAIVDELRGGTAATASGYEATGQSGKDGRQDSRRVEISTEAQPSVASEVHVSRPDFFGPEMEGDYRPVDERAATEAVPPRVSVPHDGAVVPQVDFLLRLADALNNTLDLQTLLTRLSDLVRAVVQYRIFAILLLNERSQELWMRFQIGHTPEVERTRVKIGSGIVGRSARTRSTVLVDDVREEADYISANEEVRSELAVPLIIKNRVIGVIDLESEKVGAFTADHRRLLELVASRVAVAIENARLYTRVSRQAQTLTVLNEISREITSILDLDDLLERIGSLLKRVVDFQMFTILLWSDRTQQFEHRFSTRYGERVRRERGAVYGVGLIGSAAQLREPVLAPDVRKDPRYISVSAEVRSELAVPLLYKGRVIGVLDVEHTRLNYYNEEHQRTLTTLAGQIAIAISNARLYERIFEEEQRMERDLQMAREVQMRLLPPAPEPMPHAEFFTSFLPARSIGGDVYDFIPYGPGRIAIAIGDVSGKAAPAALYAALVMGILRLLAARHLRPADMLKALNEQLQERRLDSQYVTMLFAVWDDTTRTLQLANAGSVQPMLLTQHGGGADVRTLQAEGFPLGLFPSAEYEEFSISTQPGDMLVFFSDGMADAENRQGEMFGTERICESLQRSAPESAEGAVRAVFDAVTEFQGGAERFDDETLVILRVL